MVALMKLIREYLDVRLEKIGLRRHSGDGHKIKNVTTRIETNNGVRTRIIDIQLSEIDINSPFWDEHLRNVDISIPKLKVNDGLETRISSDVWAEWGPRICELYVGTP